MGSSKERGAGFDDYVPLLASPHSTPDGSFSSEDDDVPPLPLKTQHRRPTGLVLLLCVAGSLLLLFLLACLSIILSGKVSFSTSSTSSKSHKPLLTGSMNTATPSSSDVDFEQGSTPVSSASSKHLTVVGERAHQPQYFGQGCTSSQFLEAIRGVKVHRGGLAHVMPANRSFALDDFEFSFEWPTTCPPPHVFSSEEACDLMSAFGAFVTSGDSLTRHVVNALMIVLRDSPHGAIHNPNLFETCQGDAQFDDAGKSCRLWAVADSHLKSLPEPVCGGKVRFAHFEHPCPVDPTGFVPRYLSWFHQFPAEARALSPVFLNSFGLHCGMKPSISLLGVIKPLLQYASRTFPRPITLWGGVHAPGNNKPEQYVASQGRTPVERYNEKMEKLISELGPRGGGIMEGAMGFISWFGLTDGAKSYDGTHYAYQINMEKAHLLLNLLDILWGEAVQADGLWDVGVVCPGGRGNYQCGGEHYWEPTQA